MYGNDLMECLTSLLVISLMEMLINKSFTFEFIELRVQINRAFLIDS